VWRLLSPQIANNELFSGDQNVRLSGMNGVAAAARTTAKRVYEGEVRATCREKYIEIPPLSAIL
jgi:hypothetical protein